MSTLESYLSCLRRPDDQHSMTLPPFLICFRPTRPPISPMFLMFTVFGRLQVFAYTESGQVVGELAVLFRAPRAATVKVLAGSRMS